MIQHAMRYVQMSQNVRAALSPDYPQLEAQLESVEDELVEAERALVSAYGNFRDLMQRAVNIADSPEAARYLEVTTWDLT